MKNKGKSSILVGVTGALLDDENSILSTNQHFNQTDENVESSQLVENQS
jgi:hypothetical protein